jgi:hypothetical protein
LAAVAEQSGFDGRFDRCLLLTGLRLLSKPAARLAALLLVFWPSYAFLGLAQKELVLVAYCARPAVT